MSDLAFGAKQPYEEYYVEFDFVNDMDENDTIASTEVVVMDGVNDVTDVLTDFSRQLISDTRVSVWIMGGVTGTTYVITCKITTSVLAELYECEANLLVQET